MAFSGTVTGAMAVLSLAFAPIAAQANTRAADYGTSYAPAADDDDDDDDGVAVWALIFGGVGIWAVFAAAIDGGSGKDKPTVPNNQSNGAN